MSALVKLSISSGRAAYLRLETASGVGMKTVPSNLGIELSGGQLVAFGGQQDGEIIETGVLKANSKGLIRLGSLRPTSYHALVVINPELTKIADVGAPQMIEPSEACVLDLRVSALKQVNLHEMPWVARIYMLD